MMGCGGCGALAAGLWFCWAKEDTTSFLVVEINPDQNWESPGCLATCEKVLFFRYFFLKQLLPHPILVNELVQPFA